MERTPEKQASLPEKAELEKDYYSANQVRLLYESYGQETASQLRLLLEAGHDEQSSEEIKNLISRFKLYENNVAFAETEMINLELQLDFDIDQSDRFERAKNDVLISSALLYSQRIDELKRATDNPEVDRSLIWVTVKYNRILERETDPAKYIRFDNEGRDEMVLQDQIRRSETHNLLIREINKLNDLAREKELEPLTYRNLVRNFAADNYENNPWQCHDRDSAALYMSLVVKLSADQRWPDSKLLSSMVVEEWSVKEDGSAITESELKRISPLSAHKFAEKILKAVIGQQPIKLTEDQIQEIWEAICDQTDVPLKRRISVDQACEIVARACSLRLSQRD